MDASSGTSLETILIVVVLAFATVYGVRWLVAARGRRNRRIAAGLSHKEIDDIIANRDDDHEALNEHKATLLVRLFQVGVGLVLTFFSAVALSVITDQLDLENGNVGLTIGWVSIFVCITLCIATLLFLLARPLVLIFRITDADQMITDEMRAASVARRVEASRKPRRRWFRRTAG